MPFTQRLSRCAACEILRIGFGGRPLRGARTRRCCKESRRFVMATARHLTTTSTSRTAWASCSSFRSEEHTSELQSHSDLVCRLLLEKKKKYRHKERAGMKRAHTSK